ncbi:MAG: PIN domain-containing protein [Opitutaceae bacterium]|nr:PIN domain-containing protein [Opitutaceae bacterium]
MTAQFFVDTNIILYAAGHDPVDQAKRSLALAVLEKPNLGVSGQVLQEFVSNALSKKSLVITEAKIHAVLRVLDEFPCVPVTPELVREAIRLRSRHQISYWDAAILAAAQTLGCHTLYSEDLNHGQLYDAVRVINPLLSEHAR